MSSNLFKSYYLNRNTDNARIINSNEMIAQKLERVRMVMPEANLGNGGFEPVNLFGEGNVIDPADILSADFVAEGEGANPSSVIKASDFVQDVILQPVYEGPTPEELIAQAKEKELGNTVAIPCNMLRMGERVFLDDQSVEDVENALQVPVIIVKSSGLALFEAMLGYELEED